MRRLLAGTLLIVAATIGVIPPVARSVQAQTPGGSTRYVFGNNSEGQIGNGATGSSSAPFTPSGMTGVVDAVAGPWHSLALKADGTVWGWGDNDAGQLGNNSTTRSLSPVQASGLSSAVRLAQGGYHSVALKSNGTVWTWGRNDTGQLGAPPGSACTWDDGNGRHTGACSRVPIQVTDLSGVPTTTVSVAAGANHTLAVKIDGTA